MAGKRKIKTDRVNAPSQLQNMLVINDDAEDILALQERLPSSVNVMVASQFQARNLTNFNYDVVLLDNDANNRKDSKGKETLEVIRRENPNVGVIYTSFQPGHVPAKVYKTQGVEVIRTDTLPQILQNRFGLQMKAAEERKEISPDVSLILTYNDVDGYPTGVYSQGKLIVVSGVGRAYTAAKQVLADRVGEIYQNFEWRRDRDLIKNIFVYDGQNGGDYPGQAAAGLGHDLRMRVNLVACSCDWGRKIGLKNSTYINLFQVECGGQSSLGRVADVTLGVKRPGINYSQMNVPQEFILNQAERYRI